MTEEAKQENNTYKATNTMGALEALLFVYGEEMQVKRAAKILNISEKDVSDLIVEMEARYESEMSGLQIVSHGGRIQLVTKPEFSDVAQSIIQDEMQESLTGAASEALALIAYSGPLSRAQIDYIRGVNSSFILRSLLMRGLIEREQDPKRQNAYIYSVSFDFLKKLGVQSSEQLPEYLNHYEKIQTFLNLTEQNEPENKI